MPHFDEFGGDEWICQTCTKIFNSKVESTWIDKAEGGLKHGNACPDCVVAHDLQSLEEGPTSLREYCQEESGGLTGVALDRYINRYYGHN